MLEQPLEHFRLVLKLLIAALGGLLGLFDAALHHLDIRHDELQINDIDISLGVCAALDMDNVLIVEAAHDVNDRVGRADV